MLEYRRGRPEDYPAYLAFADRVFTEAYREHHFDRLLPKVYAPGQPTAHLQYLAVDDRLGIRGLVAHLPGTLHAGGQVLRTAYIGTVSVCSEARGEGHMIELMRRTMRELREDGTDLVLLSGLRQRYGYFGFEKGGERWRYDVHEANIRHALRGIDASALSFRPILADTEDERWAQALQQRQPLWYDRGIYGYALTCQSFEGVPWLILREGEPCGSLVVNEGSAHIHELLHDETVTLPQVLKAWQRQAGVMSLRVTLPSWQTEDRLALQGFAESMSYSWSENICMLDYARVVRALLPVRALSHPLPDGRLSLFCDGQPMTVTVEHGTVTVTEAADADAPRLTHEQAQRLLLFPFETEERALAPRDWFPLPVYTSIADEF